MSKNICRRMVERIRNMKVLTTKRGINNEEWFLPGAVGVLSTTGMFVVVLFPGSLIITSASGK